MNTDQNDNIHINIRPPALRKNTQIPHKYEPPQVPKPQTKIPSKYIPVSNNKVNQSSSRIKLRDYLFLAQTSSTKSAHQKRRGVQNNAEQKRGTASSICDSLEKGKERGSFRKSKQHKYEMENSEMMSILKTELQSQLTRGIRQLQNLKEQLAQTVSDKNNPTNAQMVTMYNLRSLAKEKMRKDIADMKKLVDSARDMKHSSISSQIELEEHELNREMTVIKQMMSKKYLYEKDNNLQEQ